MGLSDMIIKTRIPDWLDVKKVERLKRAKYVGMFAPKNKNGNWINESYPLFYTKTAHPEGSNYFMIGLTSMEGIPFIFDGISATQTIYTAAVVSEDEAIYSEYRHHFNSKNDIFIDGGQEYIHTNATKFLTFKIIDGKLEIMDNEGDEDEI